MADKAKAEAGRKDIDPMVWAGEIQKEILRQKQFGPTWGEVCKGYVPKSIDEALEAKRKELADIERKVSQELHKSPIELQMQTTTGIYADCAEKPDPEAGYKKGYRVLRAGV